MSVAQEYKLFKYQDYGMLGNKEHIRLMRNTENGEICIKKQLDYTQRDVIDFRKKNSSTYFPKLYEILEEDEELLVIEEYINGVTLEEYMSGKPLSETEAVQFAIQICKALLELHCAEPMIVYRDLKADNIMITTSREVKLIDFNISRTFREGQKRDTVLLGTAEYAAPEQFGFFQTDNRTDIYSFGVVFNYMLTAKFPIDGISAGIYQTVIQKCIEMEPSKRYQSVEEILKDLGAEKEEKVNSPTTKSWVIPGFRSGTKWKMFLAIMGYCFIFWIGLTMNFTEENGAMAPIEMQWINRILFTMAQITTVLMCCNYRGMSEGFPPYNSKSAWIRITSYIVTWFAMVVVAVAVSTLLETIFGL